MTTTDIPVAVADEAIAAEVLAGGAPADEREERLDAGAASLAGGRRRAIFLHERFLVGVAGTLMTVGIVVIAIGWHGASQSILVAEQVPYLISGGLLGLALAIIGALTFFTHWLAVLVRDSRRQHQDLVRVIQEERARDRDALLDAVRSLREEGNHGRAGSGSAQRPVRRAPRGS